MKELLRKVLDCYFIEYAKRFGHPPMAVRTNDIFIPHINAETGEWGEWQPEPTQNVVPAEIFSEFYGEPFPEELYEFISCWRFAEFDFQNDNVIYYVSAVYEDRMHRPNVLMSISIDNTLYYLIGTALDQERDLTFGIFYKSTGGVFMVEDGTAVPQLLDNSIRDFLTRGVK